MANPLRGEVEIVVGPRTYTLRLATNALIEAETLLDKGVGEIADMLQDPAAFRLGTARALLFAGLRERHPNLSLFDAGEIIGELGIAPIVQKLGESMAAAFPAAEADESKNPPGAGPAGTGRGSIVNSSGSASTRTATGS